MLREQVADGLKLPIAYLDALARRASVSYTRYTVPKRNGGERVIHHPVQELKAVQRWLLREVVGRLPTHECATAYRQGRGTRYNAELHAGSIYSLRMDFQDFFPSITQSDVVGYIDKNSELFRGWSSEDIPFFTSLVCRFGKLVIGAPTSPSLSNVLCRQLDVMLSALCSTESVVYSRYADDLFFSSSQPRVLRPLERTVIDVVGTLDNPAGLQINGRKTRHLSRRSRRMITGLVITSDGKISLGRTVKRGLRTQVYKLDTLSTDQRRQLAGMLAYVKSVEPSFLNRLVLRYGPSVVKSAMRPEGPEQALGSAT